MAYRLSIVSGSIQERNDRQLVISEVLSGLSKQVLKFVRIQK